MIPSFSSSDEAEPQISFLAFLNRIPDPVVIKNRQHQWIIANELFCKLIGIQPQEAIEKLDTNFFPAQLAEQIWQTVEQVFTTGISQIIEIALPLLQEKPQPFIIQCFKVDGTQDEVYVAMCFRAGSCSQQQRAAEAALRQSYATSRALVEAIPDLLVRMRSDGTQLDISFEGEFKHKALAAPKHKTVYECLPPQAAQLRKFYVQKALEVNELQVYDQEIVIDGQVVYEEVRIIPSGEDEVLTMIRDVTARKRAELELQQLNEQLEAQVEARTEALKKVVTQLEQEISDRKLAKAQLQEKEEFLRTIFENIEHPIFVIDVSPDQKFYYVGWNHHAEKLAGISSEAIFGKTPEEVFEPATAQEVTQRYAYCLQKGIPVIYEEYLVLQGEGYWSITTLNPIKDSHGKICRIVGTAIDISDRKRTEIALQQSETQLRQQAQELQQTLQELQVTQMQLIQNEKMSSLGQLVAGVAHEINNPVNFIYGNLKHASDYTQDLLHLINLFQEYYPSPASEIHQAAAEIDLDFIMEDLPKLLHSMKVGADRIQSIVASLRTFSRMDEAEMKAVDLAECLDSTLMILQSRIKEQPDRPAILIIKHYATLPLVECYAGQLNQVFMNILSNAIDAVEESFVNRPLSLEKVTPMTTDQEQMTLPTITIHLQPSRTDWVRIAIADNGFGIPEEIQARIFDPFFTTKPIGKGTGMGLSISYQIVTEMHQGSLTCHSTPETGTQFVIEIPIHQSPT
ncbi:MAG: PAS domain S-box protein [Leptolyngbyaceae cyanobacterium bins.302]|nr:PAS domain S-box protein [Leptolyngbyaceae cyanobacterium bins.302]